MQENEKYVTIDDYEDVPPSSERALQKAVAGQPVTVAIASDSSAFKLYESVKFLKLY